MKTPTPMVDAVAFTINRDVVVDVYPANEVVPAKFARGLESRLMEALRHIRELLRESAVTGTAVGDPGHLHWHGTRPGVPSMITKLHELPPDHPLRNTAIKDIDVRIKCRHTGATRDPRTWKIKADTYNRLCESWQNNFDWIINK